MKRAPCYVIEVASHSITQIVLQALVLTDWNTAPLHGAGCTDKWLHLGSSMKINAGRRPSVTAPSICNNDQTVSTAERFSHCYHWIVPFHSVQALMWSLTHAHLSPHRWGRLCKETLHSQEHLWSFRPRAHFIMYWDSDCGHEWKESIKEKHGVMFSLQFLTQLPTICRTKVFNPFL